MSGIMLAAAAASNVLSAVVNTSGGSKVEKAAAIKEALIDKTALIRTDGSITKLLNAYTVEPILIVSHNASKCEVIEKVIELNADIFCSYYLQAFEILKTMHGLNSTIAIDLLSTDAGVVGSIIKGGINKLSSESHEPDYIDMLYNDFKITISRENNASHIRQVSKDDKDSGYKYGILERKLLVTIGYRVEDKNKERIELPITIKAHTVFASLDNIITILEPNSRDKTFSARLDEYRSGAISLAQLVTSSDLIEQYKKNKIKDKEGLLDFINSRVLSANSKVLLSKGKAAVGFEKYYNMLMITAEDKVRIDRAIGGDITKEANKQQLLNQVYGMCYTLVDEDYERITIYTKDIRGVSTTSFKALARRKDGNVDYSELVKAMISNRPPVL